MASRGLKICCFITTMLLIAIALVLVILYFTVFKPKEPSIIIKSVTLNQINAAWPTLFLNFTLGLVVTVDNKNYGGFKYESSTAHLNYRGADVGESPIPADTIPAREKHDINTSVTVFADKLFKDVNFTGDFLGGMVNFTVDSTLYGKVIVFNLFKKKASGFTSCHISLLIFPVQRADSVCRSSISF